MTDNKTRPIAKPTSSNKTEEHNAELVNAHNEGYNRGYAKAKAEIEQLEKQLDNIKANADYQIEGRQLKVKELKAQIEKMKCCGNCNNFAEIYYRGEPHTQCLARDKMEIFGENEGCEIWELKE